MAKAIRMPTQIHQLRFFCRLMSHRQNTIHQVSSGRSNPWPMLFCPCPKRVHPKRGATASHTTYTAQFTIRFDYSRSRGQFKMFTNNNISGAFAYFRKGASFGWAITVEPAIPYAQYRHEEVEKSLFIPANALGNELATLATFWWRYFLSVPCRSCFSN